jgi:hypothetical protein
MSHCAPSAYIARDAPEDVSGTYSVSITNGANGCGFADWIEGASNQNIPLVITQEGEQLAGRVEGIPGALLALLHGTNEYAGRVEGRTITLFIDGTVQGFQGNCNYTWSNDVSATLEGDYLSGSLVYSRAHNGNPDCAALECETIQLLNGVRPPK